MRGVYGRNVSLHAYNFVRRRIIVSLVLAIYKRYGTKRFLSTASHVHGRRQTMDEPRDLYERQAARLCDQYTIIIVVVPIIIVQIPNKVRHRIVS